MKSKISFIGILASLVLSACQKEKFIIFIDELSEAYADKIIKAYQKKYPQKTFEIFYYNTDFIFQSIKMGRTPNLIISFDTSYARKFGINILKKHLIYRDALVFAVSDSNLFSINDLLTKGKYLAIPMHNTALQPHVKPFLQYHNLSSENYYPIYPHDFKSMALYLNKKMVSAGIMLKSQTEYYNIRGMLPYFHQALLHYYAELESH